MSGELVKLSFVGLGLVELYDVENFHIQRESLTDSNRGQAARQQ